MKLLISILFLFGFLNAQILDVKILYLEQSTQISPSEKQKIPDHTVKQQFVLEEKHDFPHSPIYIVGE